MKVNRMEPQHSADELALETLYEGDTGLSVQQLQIRLTDLSLYHGKITGYFDSQTRQALEAFQKQYGLSEVGFFGPQTWYALTFWSNETTLSLPSFLDLFKRISKFAYSLSAIPASFESSKK